MITQTETPELLRLREIAKEYALLISSYEKTLAYTRRITSRLYDEDAQHAETVIAAFDNLLLQHRTAQIIKGIIL